MVRHYAYDFKLYQKIRKCSLLKKIAIGFLPLLALVAVCGCNFNNEHVRTGRYLVQNINSDANRNKDNKNFFYANSKNIIRYSFEDECSEICLSLDYNNADDKIVSYAVWEEFIFYVVRDSSGSELLRWNRDSGEKTVLLTNKDIIVLNGGKNLETEESFIVDAYGDYLYLAIVGKYEYLCPVNEDPRTNCFDVDTLFTEDDMSGEMQQVTFKGITFERHYNIETESYITDSIRDSEHGYKILYTYIEKSIVADGKRVRFYKDTETSNFYYSIDGEDNQRNITCLQQSMFARSDIEDKHLTVENGRIVGWISVSRSPYLSDDLLQSDIDRDVFFELDIETGESRVLYDTMNNHTKIIGYQYNTIYLIKDGKVYSQLLKSDKRIELFDLPEGGYYVIDWQAGNLIIRYDESYTSGDIVAVYHIQTFLY